MGEALGALGELITVPCSLVSVYTAGALDFMWVNVNEVIAYHRWLTLIVHVCVSMVGFVRRANLHGEYTAISHLSQTSSLILLEIDTFLCTW